MNFLGPYKYVVDTIILVSLVGAILFGVHKYNTFEQGIGEARVQALWDADKALQLQKALTVQQANLVKEQAFNTSLESLTNEYVKQKNLHNASVAASASSLRDLQAQLDAANSGAAAQVAAASGGANDPTVLRDVLGSCATTLQGLAAEADAAENKLRALQEWVTDALLANEPVKP